MCRLYGFRSVINSQVHSSLVHAENALASQSLKHPDGWGVAYYRENTPHLIKSTDRAIDDHIFEKISGVVSSQTVVAHIRKATQGNLTILNSHPFQYGKWIFAHNGNLKDFDKYKDKIMAKIDPELQRFILGSTDSEVLFFLLLTQIKKRHCLSDPLVELAIIQDATEEMCKIVCEHSGPLYNKEEIDPTQNHITYILTSGKVMAAFNGGMDLNYSTYKSSCSEKDTCAHYAKVCENPVEKQSAINHLIFSSEILKGENIWLKMEKGRFIGVDADMNLYNNLLNVPLMPKE